MRYSTCSSKSEQIREHLLRCDGEFHPPLSARVAIADYARKLHDRATTFEAWEGDNLVGLVALYVDEPGALAYLSNVSVEAAHARRGIASRLLDDAIEFARDRLIRQISLEVAHHATNALGLYAKFGFEVFDATTPVVKMRLCLRGNRK